VVQHDRHTWDAKQHSDVAGMQQIPHSMLTQYMLAMQLQASSICINRLMVCLSPSRYNSSHHLPECKASFSQTPQKWLPCRITRMHSMSGVHDARTHQRGTQDRLAAIVAQLQCQLEGWTQTTHYGVHTHRC